MTEARQGGRVRRKKHERYWSNAMLRTPILAWHQRRIWGDAVRRSASSSAAAPEREHHGSRPRHARALTPRYVLPPTLAPGAPTCPGRNAVADMEAGTGLLPGGDTIL